MKRIVRTILSAGACAVLLMLSGCTPNGGSIFYILENEVKQPPSSLGENINAFDVVRTNAGTYYAAAGPIFVNNAESATLSWLPATRLDVLPVAGALCNVLGYYTATDTLYGGFYTTSGNLGLYEVNAALLAAGTGVWTQVSDTAIAAGAQVISLQEANGQILAVTAVENTDPSTNKDQPNFYTLSFSTGGVFTALLSGVTTKITGAWFDGASYYAVAGTTYYKGTDAAAMAASATSSLGTYTITSPDALNGVYRDGAAGSVYVSSASTGIYVWNGATWSNVAPDSQGGTPVVYLGISGPVTGSTGSNILFGCEKYGFYYYNGSVLSRSADTQMLTLKLYYAVIRKLVIIGTDVFACTQGSGLWKGTLDATNPSGIKDWTIQ